MFFHFSPYEKSPALSTGLQCFFPYIVKGEITADFLMLLYLITAEKATQKAHKINAIYLANMPCFSYMRYA